MATIHLQGKITELGTLEIELPAGLPPGDAQVTIELGPGHDWSTEELAEALRIEPLTGAEIVAAGLTGGWKEAGIDDSLRWVEEQRHRRQEERRR